MYWATDASYKDFSREGKTVRKALKVLEKQGLIVSRGSKGFFVIET